MEFRPDQNSEKISNNLTYTHSLLSTVQVPFLLLSGDVVSFSNPAAQSLLGINTLNKVKITSIFPEKQPDGTPSSSRWTDAIWERLQILLNLYHLPAESDENFSCRGKDLLFDIEGIPQYARI